MEKLNTDCLIKIAKYLSLKNQISLLRVDTNCEMAVTTLWRTKYVCFTIDFYKDRLPLKELSIFLEVIKNFVEKMALYLMTKQKYAIYKKHCFKRVKHLVFSEKSPLLMNDEDLRDLSEIFPNLEELKLTGNFSGLYIDRLQSLKVLTFCMIESLQVKNMQTIMSQLKLEKLTMGRFIDKYNYMEFANTEYLKYLHITAYETPFFINRPLPALQELLIYCFLGFGTRRNILLSMLQTKDFHVLEVPKGYNFLSVCLKLNLKVKDLTLIDDKNSLPGYIIPFIHQLTNLRRLCFANCFIKTNDFINLLYNVPQINEICFKYCNFDSIHMFINASEVGARRSNKLTLNLYKNKLVEQEPLQFIQDDICVHVFGKHDLFQLTHIHEDYMGFRLRGAYQ